MYVTLRPYLNYFLEKMVNLYHIVLFTSATQEYADEVREIIDPDGAYIKAVFSRKHCFELTNKVGLSQAETY